MTSNVGFRYFRQDSLFLYCEQPDNRKREDAEREVGESLMRTLDAARSEPHRHLAGGEDIMGVSGQRTLRALAAGEESAEPLSWKLRGKLRMKRAQIKEAMKAEFTEFHRNLLTLNLKHFDFLRVQVEWLEGKLTEHMAPYAQQVKLLDSIPGIDQIVAWNLLAELGPDMSVFPDAAHCRCASWAGGVRGPKRVLEYSGVGGRRRGTGICGRF